ncbi:MAG: MaoC family dehydratase [Actinomycetota bacterium]
MEETPVHHDMEAAFGRCLEDFRLGDTFRHWPAKTITESDNNLFCLLTRNPHPVHSDVEYAAGQQHGRVLVVGTLVLSLTVGMSVPDISGRAIANLDYEAVRHEGPVFLGDTIRAETEVLEVRRSASKSDRGVVLVETRAFNQRGERVLSLRRHLLVPVRGTEE